MTKEELKQIYYLNKEIKMWQDELNKIKNQSLIKSRVLTGMPRAQLNNDNVADMAVEISNIQTIIESKLLEIQIQRKRIINYINSIEDSLLRQVMFLRNVSSLSWEEVAAELNITENCVKQMYSRHFKRNKTRHTCHESV